MNAYEILSLVRDYVAEAVEEHWNDVFLMRRINLAHREAAVMFGLSPGGWLLTSASVTPVDSVITLPSDCVKPVYLEDSSGNPIDWLESVRARRLSRTIGATMERGANEAYPLAGSIEVNTPNYTTECTLWYQFRVPDLVAGVAGSGSGSNTLVLEEDGLAAKIDDYYNDSVVEVLDSSAETLKVRSVISDYVASTRTMTITGTAASGDLYGTESRLPEEAMPFVITKAVYLALLKRASVIEEGIRNLYRDEARRLKGDLEDFLSSRVPSGTLIGDML